MEYTFAWAFELLADIDHTDVAVDERSASSEGLDRPWHRRGKQGAARSARVIGVKTLCQRRVAPDGPELRNVGRQPDPAPGSLSTAQT